MFGYVVVNQERLEEEQYNVYRSFYCGLCRQLIEDYGKSFSILLNNDMTFLALLLSALQEPETDIAEIRCPIHPLRTVTTRRNRYTEYAAEMTILLSYYKALDDVMDEGKGKTLLKKLEKPMGRIRQKYPETVKKMEDVLQRIGVLEKEGCCDPDLLCNTFGESLGTIFACTKDVWDGKLYAIGYELGKFIYLMDAYDDLQEDRKKGTFNPLKERAKKENFTEEIESILELFMSRAADAFERLPVIEYTEILRNILYSGVWTRMEQLKQEDRA